MRIWIALITLMLVVQPLAMADEKDYYEAMINLQSIEKFFTGAPIHLSKDEDLKSNLRNKLNRIIDNLESYYKTDPKEPNNYRVLFLLGKSYSFSHDLDVSGAWHKSVEYFDKALVISPNSEEVLMVQGKNYMDAANFERALELYEKAVQSNPVGRGRLYVAIAKTSLGRAGETKEDLRKHLEIYPDDEYAKKVLNAVEEGRAFGPN